MKSQGKKGRVARKAVAHKTSWPVRMRQIGNAASVKAAAPKSEGKINSIDTKNYAEAINYLISYEREEMNALIYASGSKA